MFMYICPQMYCYQFMPKTLCRILKCLSIGSDTSEISQFDFCFCFDVEVTLTEPCMLLFFGYLFLMGKKKSSSSFLRKYSWKVNFLSLFKSDNVFIESPT